MHSENEWRRIEELFTQAQKHRRAVLADVDPQIRLEVEKLLTRDSEAPAQHPAPTMGLMPGLLVLGSMLGPYRLEALLGAGGMGKVYRALDTRLGRAVAIKVADEKFTDRFEREIRALSALNHPHICTLYDVGPNYLVMELVEGETLAARLRRGRLKLDEDVSCAIQVADALGAAHACGVIHRDLKPSNIMLSKAGVKLVDFGVAKQIQPDTPTVSLALIGTPAYMAPEQLEGGKCDGRTDIFALGLLISEMSGGKRGSIDKLPPRLLQVVSRCVEPDPEDRWQSAKDLKVLLEWVSVNRTEPIKRVLPRWTLAAAPALVALGLGSGWWAFRPRLSPLHPQQSTQVSPKSGRDLPSSQAVPDGNPTDSIRIVAISPPTDNALTVGQTVSFRVEVEYNLATTGSATIGLVVQGNSEHSNLGSTTEVVTRGRGKILLNKMIQIPETSAILVFTPLREEGSLSTRIVDSRAYKVVK